jgi:hypothetical protein
MFVCCVFLIFGACIHAPPEVCNAEGSYLCCGFQGIRLNAHWKSLCLPMEADHVTLTGQTALDIVSGSEIGNDERVAKALRRGVQEIANVIGIGRMSKALAAGSVVVAWSRLMEETSATEVTITVSGVPVIVVELKGRSLELAALTLLDSHW